jgi:hypothetical protein
MRAYSRVLYATLFSVVLISFVTAGVQAQTPGAYDSNLTKIRKSNGEIVEGEIRGFLLFGKKDDLSTMITLGYYTLPGKSVETIDEKGVSFRKDARCLTFVGLGVKSNLKQLEDDFTLTQYATAISKRSEKGGQLPSGLYLMVESKECVGTTNINPILGELRELDKKTTLNANIEMVTKSETIQIPVNEIVQYWKKEAKQ